MMKAVWISIILLSVCMTAAKAETLADGKAIAEERSGAASWLSGGRDYSEQHFSPLAKISASTVKKLGLAWSLDLPGEQTLEATPLAVDGVLYFTGELAAVYAVDAVKGTLLWRYDPEVWKAKENQLRFLFHANRGLAYWKGKLFVCTFDGRLIALEAKTGKVVWSTMTLDRPGSMRYSTGAPRVFNDKVVIGNGGADYGERGYVTVYSTETGKQLWRFFITPGNPADGFESEAMKMAAETWTGEWWRTGTGGSVWDGMTYDPEMNRLYLGTGNSGPYNPAVRSPGGGDNLFLCSIVALDADTGKYIWHYQVNPREAWDYKATANIVLADLTIAGKPRKVLMQSPTNGFFYVIDRITGKLISAEKIGKVTWAERIDLASGRPVEAPNIRYEKGPVTIWPYALGAHNWQPMSYSPATGLVYIPYMQAGTRYSVDPNSPIGMTITTVVDENDKEDGKGKLLAWDPVAQKVRWSVPRSSLWNGGTLATAGNLVFQGDQDGLFHAYDARNGKELWKFDAKLGIIAAPITYAVGGTQYVSLLVGHGGASAFLPESYDSGWKYGVQQRRLLTFALGKKAKLPTTPPRDFTVSPVDDESLTIDEKAVTAGAGVYGSYGCFGCHGTGLRARGAPAPDLRESHMSLKYESFAQLMRGSALEPQGMPKYPEISDEDMRALFMYIRASAREALGKRKPSGKPAAASRL